MTKANDTNTDLGLAVSNISAAGGAGANANSLEDMMSFVGSDTLAELVWSSQTGLNVKFARKKPSRLLDVGPSDFRFLRSEDNQDGKQISKSRSVASVASVASCHVSGEVVKSSSSAEPLSKRVFEKGMTSGVDGPGYDNKSPMKVEVITHCAPQEHVESRNTDLVTVKFIKDGSQDANFENEKIAENDDPLIGVDKEKSLDCRENNDNLEVESHGCMESFQNAIFLAKRKRPSFEHQMIPEPKKIKKKPDESSFVSWISNMLIRLKNHENCDKKISVCDETRNIQSGKMGFQNVFRSLYIHDEKAHETFLQIENKEAPKGMFDAIRRLRLSRTDILKWSNSRLPVANLDGFFLRLRVAKSEEGAGGSRYYVACIKGLQGEKQPIRVKVGGVECSVENQNISNCDFLEDELMAWWQKTSKSGRTPVVKDLKSKLAERITMGL